jgi:hypothetical protein
MFKNNNSFIKDELTDDDILYHHYKNDSYFDYLGVKQSISINADIISMYCKKEIPVARIINFYSNISYIAPFIDDIKIDNIKTDNIKTYNIKIDNIKIDNIKTDDIKTDNIKTDDIKTDDIKTDDIKTDDIKTDDIKTDDIKTDDIKTYNIKTDDIKIDDIKTDNIKTDNIKTDNIKTDDIKTDEMIGTIITVQSIEKNTFGIEKIINKYHLVIGFINNENIKSIKLISSNTVILNDKIESFESIDVKNIITGESYKIIKYFTIPDPIFLHSYHNITIIVEPINDEIEIKSLDFVAMNMTEEDHHYCLINNSDEEYLLHGKIIYKLYGGLFTRFIDSSDLSTEKMEEFNKEFKSRLSFEE